MNHPLIFAIDFDGTCVTHDYPRIGKDIGAAPVLKALTDAGHKLILWTMRANTSPSANDPMVSTLDEAMAWFEQNGIPLYGVNKNPDQQWSTSPKAYAHHYIDDAAIGIPLTFEASLSNRSFVDWAALRVMLHRAGAFGEVPVERPNIGLGMKMSGWDLKEAIKRAAKAGADHGSMELGISAAWSSFELEVGYVKVLRHILSAAAYNGQQNGKKGFISSDEIRSIIDRYALNMGLSGWTQAPPERTKLLFTLEGEEEPALGEYIGKQLCIDGRETSPPPTHWKFALSAKHE